MQIYVLDNALNIIDILDNYASIIWATRYFSPGDFELYVPATSKMLSDLQKDRYLVRDDDLKHAMIIQNIEISTDIENGNFLTVTGKCLKSILNRRIIWSQTVLNGNIETELRRLVNENIISSSVATRNLSNLILGDVVGFTDIINVQYTGDNLGETVASICKTYKLGYDITLDLDTKQFTFILYKGSDRSYNQNTNPYVIFSNEFENLLSTTYKVNSDNFRNVARVGGEGEGNSRKYVTSGSASGLARYELFVDAKDVSSNNGEITSTAYNTLLQERGIEKLAEHIVTEKIEGDIESDYTYKLNVDYFLGDVVEVVNEYGISMTPRITEIIENEDHGGRHVIPTFASDEE